MNLLHSFAKPKKKDFIKSLRLYFNTGVNEQ